MQPLDFTTLTALCQELRTTWLPARLEQVYQRDRFTLSLALRTLEGRGWLNLSWHPQAAHLCIGNPPPRIPDTFTFSQQIRHQVGNLALVAIATVADWERVLDFQFARRPGEPALWHLYIEIMGKYSNVILVNQEGTVIAPAHQVTANQSSVRPILTGQPYELPPVLTEPAPTLDESLDHWRERVSLIPGPLRRNLLKTYRGLSSALILSMVQAAGLDPESSTDQLQPQDWQALFQRWQEWLQRLATGQFQPGWTEQGYTVLGWGMIRPAQQTQQVVCSYYTHQLNQQVFSQLRHQLGQKLGNLLEKLRHKAAGFQGRLQQADQADHYRHQADLLMAHLAKWKPGMKQIILPDFETDEPVTVPLDPERTMVQNAQVLYRKHQKLKRTRGAIEPLLIPIQEEITYLEQVEAALQQFAHYQSAADLEALEEIREELIQQGYMAGSDYRRKEDPSDTASQPYRYTSPNGYEVLVGRNNRQNDRLSFRTAGDYDLWFHAQEIPGSHVLLRLPPGVVPEETDLQFTANLTAYHSRGRQSEQVPIVYTEPRHVYKPRGAKPGIAIYKQERILWGQPHQASPLTETGED